MAHDPESVFTLLETWVTGGHEGQYLLVIPSLELVVAFTGHNCANGSGIENLYRMMSNHILESIN